MREWVEGRKTACWGTGSGSVVALGPANVPQAPSGLDRWAFAVVVTANVPVISRLLKRGTFTVVRTANVPHTRPLERWGTFADGDVA